MDALIRRHAQRLGLSPEQLTQALLQYASQQLADWAEAEETADPGSVWCAGDPPDWLEPYLPQREGVGF